MRVVTHLCPTSMKRKPQNQPVRHSASTQDVMMVQETMNVMGLYDGPIDGLAGTETMRAVRQYKKSIHLAPNNTLSEDFIDHLRNET